MSEQLDQETREHLHAVLSHMVQSEAKSYYREPEEDRKTWAYESVRFLLRRFDFEDLLKADAKERQSAEWIP